MQADISTKPATRLIVVGCGPHFKQLYLAVLARYAENLKIVLAIDLQCEERRVREAFSRSRAGPSAYLFLPDSWRVNPQLVELRAALASRPEAATADAMLICTEPKARKCFILWALDNGIPVFMDKPVTAFRTYDDVESLQTDFAEILELRRRAGVRVVVSCERRMHIGYLYLESFLRQFIERQKVPITFANIHFGGGLWMMPSEYPVVENHPFKYGYGVLLHSGYHYVDLVARLAQLNCSIRDVALELPRVRVNASFPRDVLDAVGGDVYGLFTRDGGPRDIAANNTASLERFGEVDISAQGSYLAGGRKCFDFSLQLISTTVSARTDDSRRPGAGQTVGRMRQEQVVIHVGHLCSISVQSSSFGKIDPTSEGDDFNITIAMSPLSTAGPRVLRLDRKALSRLSGIPEDARLNVLARQNMLRAFLAGRDARSELASHGPSIRLLTEIFSQVRRDLPESSCNDR